MTKCLNPHATPEIIALMPRVLPPITVPLELYWRLTSQYPAPRGIEHADYPAICNGLLAYVLQLGIEAYEAKYADAPATSDRPTPAPNDDATETITLTIADLATLVALAAGPDVTGELVNRALTLARSLDRSSRASAIVINTANSTASERQS